MSLTLFRREVRAHWVLALVFAAVMTLYGSMIVSMFDPKLGESLAMMAESMPQIFAAFNMTDPGATLTEFLANYLYGFLFIVLPMVAILILAAGLAAQRITEEEKLALSKMHRLYEMAVEARDKEEIVEYDEKFHNFIVRCSRNNVLIELSRQVQELSMRFRYLYYDDGTVFERIPKEHKHVMEAIVAGDAEKARREAEAHIKDLKQFIIGLDKVTR